MTLVPRKTFLPVVILVWLVVSCVGLQFLLSRENSPGRVGVVPKLWPIGSRVHHSATLPTLVMMVHPRCPCSRASLGELEILMATNQKRVNAIVVFVRPQEFSDEWEKTDLWRLAAAIPGISLAVDSGGVEARRFGSLTSGQVTLYAPEGQLLFSGGITSSRGHSGDNEGRNALDQMLAQTRAERSETPVYGCPLFREAGPIKPEDLCDASHQ